MAVPLYVSIVMEILNLFLSPFLEALGMNSWEERSFSVYKDQVNNGTKLEGLLEL